MPWKPNIGGPGIYSPVDEDAIHDNVASEIHSITEKASPVSADELVIEDSAASYAKKRVQIGNLPGGASAALQATLINKAGAATVEGYIYRPKSDDQLSNRSDFKWTASVSGTNEYYCEAAGGGDPGLYEPDLLFGNSATFIKDDDMSADNTGDWTDDGANISLAFDTDHYEVTTSAANQRTWLTGASITKGKIYRLEIKIKDGTTSSKNIQMYINDGITWLRYSLSKVTSGSWALHKFSYVAKNTTASAVVGIRVVDSLGGNNLELKDFQFYEINTQGTQGTVGSLADHEWDWGDNDTLGYSTVYYRDDSGDPDTTGIVIIAKHSEAFEYCGNKITANQYDEGPVRVATSTSIADGASGAMYVGAGIVDVYFDGPVCKGQYAFPSDTNGQATSRPGYCPGAFGLILENRTSAGLVAIGLYPDGLDRGTNWYDEWGRMGPHLYIPDGREEPDGSGEFSYERIDGSEAKNAVLVGTAATWDADGVFVPCAQFINPWEPDARCGRRILLWYGGYESGVIQCHYALADKVEGPYTKGPSGPLFPEDFFGTGRTDVVTFKAVYNKEERRYEACCSDYHGSAANKEIYFLYCNAGDDPFHAANWFWIDTNASANCHTFPAPSILVQGKERYIYYRNSAGTGLDCHVATAPEMGTSHWHYGGIVMTAPSWITANPGFGAAFFVFGVYQIWLSGDIAAGTCTNGVATKKAIGYQSSNRANGGFVDPERGPCLCPGPTGEYDAERLNDIGLLPIGSEIYGFITGHDESDPLVVSIGVRRLTGAG